MNEENSSEIFALIKRSARLKALLAVVKRLSRRDKYRLYMSMMGANPYMVDDEDWAHTLHKMVAGSHNIDAYEKEIVTISDQLNQKHHLNQGEYLRLYKQILVDEPEFLEPILNLAGEKLQQFFDIAGNPANDN